MQEELQSLSSIQTVSVWDLLTDRCVRWQLITIAVVNIGMQLSGIDAVSVKKVFFSPSLCIGKGCALLMRATDHATIFHQFFFISLCPPTRLYIIFAGAAPK